MKFISSCVFLLLTVVVTSNLHYDKILLSDVDALTFQAGKFTTWRRNSMIPQLNCEGGNCLNGPNNMMCRNMGRGDKDFIWECTGYGLTPGYKLASSDVSCEGYDYPDDPYILKGSCGVFYTVNKDYSYNKPTVTTTTTRINENSYQSYHLNPIYHGSIMYDVGVVASYCLLVAGFVMFFLAILSQ